MKVSVNKHNSVIWKSELPWPRLGYFQKGLRILRGSECFFQPWKMNDCKMSSLSACLSLDHLVKAPGIIEGWITLSTWKIGIHKVSYSWQLLSNNSDQLVRGDVDIAKCHFESLVTASMCSVKKVLTPGIFHGFLSNSPSVSRPVSQSVCHSLSQSLNKVAQSNLESNHFTTRPYPLEYSKQVLSASVSAYLLFSFRRNWI